MAPADLSIDVALRFSGPSDARETGFALVAEGGEVVGFVTRSDLRKFVALGGDEQRPVRSLSAPVASATFPDEPMRIAADRLARLDGSALPVVDPGEPSHVIGFVTREAPFDARVLWMQLEREREQTFGIPGRSAFAWVRSMWQP